MRRIHRAILVFCLVFTPAIAAAAHLAIVGAKVYAAPDSVAIPDAVVLVHGTRIVAVGPRSRIKVPPGYVVLPAAGKVVTAGFWNCHVHLIGAGLLHPEALPDAAVTSALEAEFTRWGFTTVFDLASTTASATAIRRRIADGAVLGPAILTVGEPFYPPGGTPVYAKPIYKAEHLPSAEVTTESAAVARVNAQAAAGVNGVKLFTGAIVGGAEGVRHMSATTIKAITAEAHRHGLPTFAHPTDLAGAIVAVDNGVDILAHTEALAGPWSPDFVAKLRANNIGLIPTLMLFEVDPDPRTPVAVSLQQLQVQAASGGDVLFGTDAGFMPVYDPTREYQLMARVLDWRAILASLTTTPAHRFANSDRTGRVQSGFTADLVVLDGDPASNVGNFARVLEVVRHGELIYWRVRQEGRGGRQHLITNPSHEKVSDIDNPERAGGTIGHVSAE